MPISIVISLLLLSSVVGFAKPKIQSEIYHFQNGNEVLTWFKTEENKVAADDRRGLFLKIYHEVTLEMLNLFEENKFQNPEWVKRLMFKYLSFYRNAYTCDISKACPVPPAWRRVFDENSKSKWSPGIQLLLAISAHVNRDLPIVLAQLNTDFKNETLLADFRMVSTIFSRRMPRLQSILQTYQSCRLNEAEKKFILAEVMWAMGRTRERSWKNGEKLSQTTSYSEEVALVEHIESYTRWQDNEILVLSPFPQKILCQ